MMQTSLRGELSTAKSGMNKSADVEFLEIVAKNLNISSEEATDLHERVFPCLLCSAARKGDLAQIKALKKSVSAAQKSITESFKNMQT